MLRDRFEMRPVRHHPSGSPDEGVVDLTGIAGYYTFPAMQPNAARYEAPKGARKLMRFPQ
jgi:hypothetical protein